MMRKEVRSQNPEYRISRSNARSWKHSDFYILTSMFLILLSTSCQAQKTSKPYYEDLSSLRPKVILEAKKKDSIVQSTQTENIPPKYSVNEKVDFVLDSIDRFNLTRKFVDGYTIQIYSGQKRDEALKVQKRLVEENSTYVPNIQYLQPKFRVTVGKYFTRIEAQKDLVKLKRIFSSASLVPERIMIK
jgi:SPOR domain